MAKKMGIGRIAYLIGFFGAIIVGLLVGLGTIEAGTMLTTILVLAGVIIGFMNIATKESTAFMVASLVIGAGAGLLADLAFIGPFIVAVLSAIAAVILPAAVIVAVKEFMVRAS
jgi:hypothetical protein